MGFLFVLRRIGYFIYDHWSVIAIGVVVIAGVVIFNKACNRPPKLDEKAIIKAQKAVAEQDRKEMIQILAESDTAEQNINENLANANAIKVNTIIESKQKYAGLSNEDLAKELEARK